jgi:hypothetical protein
MNCEQTIRISARVNKIISTALFTEGENTEQRVE